MGIPYFDSCKNAVYLVENGKLKGNIRFSRVIILTLSPSLPCAVEIWHQHQSKGNLCS